MAWPREIISSDTIFAGEFRWGQMLTIHPPPPLLLHCDPFTWVVRMGQGNGGKPAQQIGIFVEAAGCRWRTRQYRAAADERVSCRRDDFCPSRVSLRKPEPGFDPSQPPRGPAGLGPASAVRSDANVSQSVHS
ncbi:hypothetical protein VDGD_21758 [Verticillium dahliae]|nr:hypothetical protein VDGD_21758 [Verticillium dahliae]